MRVLCVDDEPNLLRTLGANLRQRGYAVDLATSGERALQIAADQKPDLVVLDLGLPGMSGVEVIRKLRAWTTVPIIVLSARDAEFDKIGALDAGANDYVTKPFGMGELLARIRAGLRQLPPPLDTPRIETTDLVIDLPLKTVRTEHGEAKLTPTEWSIVEVLVRNADRLVPARELLQAVWGPGYRDETNYLRVHLAHIRRKLERDPSRPRHFRTEPGMGYRFVTDPDDGQT